MLYKSESNDKSSHSRNCSSRNLRQNQCHFAESLTFIRYIPTVFVGFPSNVIREIRCKTNLFDTAYQNLHANNTVISNTQKIKLHCDNQWWIAHWIKDKIHTYLSINNFRLSMGRYYYDWTFKRNIGATHKVNNIISSVEIVSFNHEKWHKKRLLCCVPIISTFFFLNCRY